MKYCFGCNGSGEGRSDGSKCRVCLGSGLLNCKGEPSDGKPDEWSDFVCGQDLCHNCEECLACLPGVDSRALCVSCESELIDLELVEIVDHSSSKEV